MSFILDALKKSEMERQRQSTPGMVESGIAAPRRRLPMWAIALGVLLAVNLVVLVVVLTRGGAAPPQAVHAAAPESPAEALDAEKRVAPATTAAADRPAAHFSPLDAPAEYAPEITAAGVPARAAAAPLPRPAAPRQSADDSAPTTARAVRRRDPVLTNDDYKPGEESLPTINEITQTLPEMHLDVHVYATQPAERFVFINMRKYHEGATLQEGPAIEHIRRDGVVMNYQGLRFLLPRQ